MTRDEALAKLLPMQRKDFVGIFKAMGGLPVTVRLIDSRRIAHYRYEKFGVGTPMRFALVIALGLLVYP